PTTITAMVTIFIILVIVMSALQIVGNTLVLRTKYELSKDLMFKSLQDFFDAKWLFFSGNEQGKIYSTLNRELSNVGEGFMAIGTIFSNIVQMLILLIVPFYISWKVTLLCLGFGGLVSLIFVFLSRSA